MATVAAQHLSSALSVVDKQIDRGGRGDYSRSLPSFFSCFFAASVHAPARGPPLRRLDSLFIALAHGENRLIDKQQLKGTLTCHSLSHITHPVFTPSGLQPLDLFRPSQTVLRYFEVATFPYFPGVSVTAKSS
jgi:hypothetical protein